MQFPVYLHLGPIRIHPHRILEGLAYLVGFRLFLVSRRNRGDPLPHPQRWWIVAAAIAGAPAGSKLLFWLGDPLETARHWNRLWRLSSYTGSTMNHRRHHEAHLDRRT
jgi:phosphatidylglycerol---prolipoprotein diacylglyceryl transferase